MRTDFGAGVGASFTSLPWGDGYTENIILGGGDQDNEHFAGLERDAESGTEHAQFRNYASARGRWLAPDSYMGSYDLTNPQSMNRYTYALNNPVSLTDPSGLKECLDDPCEGGGGGGGFCDPFWGDCGGGDCDPIFEDCGGGLPGGPGGGGYGGGASGPSQAGNGPLHLEPNWGNDPGSFGESLGFPTALPMGSWGIAAALGLPGGPGCEFGGCEGGIDSFTEGVGTAPLDWCVEFPRLCGAAIDVGWTIESALAASAAILSLQGDNASTRGPWTCTASCNL
jgi:RHS repeat-associated protein